MDGWMDKPQCVRAQRSQSICSTKMKSKYNLILSNELTEAITSNVTPSADIIWVGTPQMKVFTMGDLVRIPILILWTAMAFSIFLLAVTHGLLALPFAILPFLFTMVGIYLLVRYVLVYFHLKNTAFVLTHKVAYTISTAPRCVRSFAISESTPVTLVETEGKVTAVLFDDSESSRNTLRSNELAWISFEAKPDDKPMFFQLKDASVATEFLTANARVRKLDLSLDVCPPRIHW